MRALLVVACLLVAPRIEANPVTAQDLTDAKLDLRLEEPIGVVATADAPKLGLLKGDIIVTINGDAAIERGVRLWSLVVSSVVHLEILRAGKPVSIKLEVQPRSFDDNQRRDHLQEVVARLRDRAELLRPVTKQGAGTGVAIGDGFVFVGATAGDIIRKIDGKRVKTAADVIAALEAGIPKPKIALELERAGRAFTVTLVIQDTPAPAPEDPELDALLDKIKKIDDTTYTIPKKLVDKLVTNPMAFAKGARIVPAIKDGKPAGFKVYAIRPNSLYAKLGLANGDTVVSVNGFELTSADKALEVYSKLRNATNLEIELVRRGKPVTLKWTIK